VAGVLLFAAKELSFAANGRGGIDIHVLGKVRIAGPLFVMTITYVAERRPAMFWAMQTNINGDWQ
jgi:hypothetical protein